MTIASLDEGEYLEFEVDSNDFAYIEADKPVLLVQFCKSYQSDYNRKSDPFMSLVPPLTQYSDYYTFTTADTLTGEEDYEHYVNILVQRGGTSRFLLDGQLLKSTDMLAGWQVVRAD